jgi:isopenicillin N synthase-like dioxygenase
MQYVSRKLRHIYCGVLIDHLYRLMYYVYMYMYLYIYKCREVSEEYGRSVVRLCELLMRVLSVSLGLDAAHFQRAFGGAACGATLRANYYPRCPQPDLTLGLSAHSDPGVLTVLLADEHVRGLQVRRGAGAGEWVTVQPVRDAFIVNVGDQVQVRRSQPPARQLVQAHGAS